MRRPPWGLGVKRSRWWLAGLQQVVAWLADCTVPGVCQILRRLQVRYKRGREYLHSPDPLYDQKMAYVMAAYHLAQVDPTHYVLLYQDEMTYYRQPTVARAYTPQGDPLPYARLGHQRNRKRRIAACLDALTGRLIAWQRTRFNLTNLLRFYQAVEAAYPEADRIFLVQDNWPLHFHPTLLLALATRRITLLRLPTYAPWTNPVEKLWLRLRQEVLHLHPFEDDWSALFAAVQTWLDQWQGGSLDLLHYVGLYPY